MYQSSIINNYGDSENVNKDIKTLNDIINRQGARLLTDVLAEHAGTTANRFKLTDTERTTLRLSLVNQLDEALKERL